MLGIGLVLGVQCCAVPLSTRCLLENLDKNCPILLFLVVLWPLGGIGASMNMLRRQVLRAYLDAVMSLDGSK